MYVVHESISNIRNIEISAKHKFIFYYIFEYNI